MECTQLRAECARLREGARPCTTCGGGDGQEPEDNCPAELAAALQKLQQAEDYITELSASFDDLRDKTLEKLAVRDVKLASVLSTLTLRDSDLASAQATISARNSDFTAIQTSLASRDVELATLHPQLAQLRVSANLAEEEWRARHASDSVAMTQLRTTAVAYHPMVCHRHAWLPYARTAVVPHPMVRRSSLGRHAVTRSTFTQDRLVQPAPSNAVSEVPA